MLSDPAHHFVEGKGFATTLFFSRADTLFFCGNVPGYPALLIPWLAIWGAGMLQVRALNYVIASAVAVLLPLALRRAGVLKSEFWIGGAMVVAMLGWPMAFVYRSGRSDLLGMSLFVLGLLAWALPKGPARAWTLLAIAAALPITGLQYLWFLPIVLASLSRLIKPAPVGEITAIALGFMVGLCLVAVWFSCVAGWEGLFATIAAQKGSSIEAAQVLFVLKAKVALRSLGRHPHHVAVFAIAALLLLAVRAAGKGARRQVLGAVGFMLATVALLLAGGVYYPNYHWMATIRKSRPRAVRRLFNFWGYFGDDFTLWRRATGSPPAADS